MNSEIPGNSHSDPSAIHQTIYFVPLLFRDRATENAYLEQMDREHRRWVNSSLVLAIVLLFALSLFDSAFVSHGSLRWFEFIRFYIWVPSVAVAFIGNLLIKAPRHSIWWITCMSMATVGSLAAMTRVAGAPSVEYLAIFTFQILLYIFFMIGLPFRYAVVVALATCLAQIGTLVSLHLGAARLGLALSMLGANSILMAVPAHRVEWTSRQNFLAQNARTREYASRLAAERDRSQWLENIAGFLRHELKNAIIGIGQGIALAEQTELNEHAATYLTRAKRSLDFMRRFLQQTAEATTLESALALHEFEPVDFSELVRERTQDHRDSTPGRLFEVHTAPGIEIAGNADRLVQMFDKLVNNAVEHSSAPCTVEIRLEAMDNVAMLTVSNRGDSLPDDCEGIFQPFISHKSGHGGENLGLGLYVARMIARHHGGSIHANHLRDPTGAEFVVQLPCSVRRLGAV